MSTMPGVVPDPGLGTEADIREALVARLVDAWQPQIRRFAERLVDRLLRYQRFAGSDAQAALVAARQYERWLLHPPLQEKTNSDY